MDVTTKIVLDTSVLVAAARSRNGASFALIASMPNPRFQICLSVAVYTEWQAVLSRAEHLPPGADANSAMGFIRYLATLAHLQDIHFLWRPFYVTRTTTWFWNAPWRRDALTSSRTTSKTFVAPNNWV